MSRLALVDLMHQASCRQVGTRLGIRDTSLGSHFAHRSGPVDVEIARASRDVLGGDEQVAAIGQRCGVITPASRELFVRWEWRSIKVAAEAVIRSETLGKDIHGSRGALRVKLDERSGRVEERSRQGERHGAL